MPQISMLEFEHLPLRVHDLLAGVPTHDVWATDLPYTRPGITLDEFLRAAGPGLLPFKDPPATRALVSLRLFLGRLFAWDREPPANTCKSFAERLTASDRSKSLVGPGTRAGVVLRLVYRFENEQLLE